MKRAVILALSVAAGCYALLCVALVSFERDLVYPVPSGLGHVTRAQVITVPSGTAMLWVAPPVGAGPAGTIVVFFHGNGDQIANAEWLGDHLNQYGFGLAAVEYPGYPGVSGAPSEASLIEAGELALKHLIGPMGIARERLVLCGQSLGSGVAVQLAARGWGRKLVLITPYTSLVDAAAEMVPGLPLRWLMRNQFDSAAWAPSITQPVLVIHGTDDEVVPHAQGQKLSTLFSPPARFISVPNATHSEVWDRQFVYESVATFILQ